MDPSPTDRSSPSSSSAAELRVRLGTLADAEALASFNEAMAAETEGRTLEPDRVRAGVRRLLARPERGFYLVAERGGTIVGALMVTPEWSDWRDGLFWWVQSVYVRPANRRRGVYRALHAYVREAAQRDEEVCGLRLYVDRDNEVAQQTYRALGMHATGYLLFEEEF